MSDIFEDCDNIDKLFRNILKYEIIIIKKKEYNNFLSIKYYYLNKFKCIVKTSH